MLLFKTIISIGYFLGLLVITSSDPIIAFSPLFSPPLFSSPLSSTTSPTNSSSYTSIPGTNTPLILTRPSRATTLSTAIPSATSALDTKAYLSVSSPLFASIILDPSSTDPDLASPAEDEPNRLLLYTVSFNTLLVICSLLLNLFIVTYYWSNSENLSSTLYLRNGIVDWISAVGILLQVPQVIRVLKGDIPPSLTLISYWITTVSVRMSVFMNCVLGVVRCINILSPFYLVNRKFVTISTLIYLILWSTIASLDVWIYTWKIGLRNMIYQIKSLVLKAEPGFSLTFLTGSDGRKMTSLSQGEVVAVQFLTPSVLPAVLCFVLMLLQIYHLTRQRVGIVSNNPTSGANKGSTSQNHSSLQEQGKEKRKSTRNHKAAVTILIVTIIYVLTAIFSVAMWLVVYRTHLGGEEKIKKLSWTELSLIYISSSTSHLLCSTVTALTLLLRSTKMQLHLKTKFRETIGFMSFQFN